MSKRGRPVYRFRQGVRRNRPDYTETVSPPISEIDEDVIESPAPLVIESPASRIPNVIESPAPHIIESPAPLKSQPIVKEMASTIYRYLHIDSADRNPHELTSRMDIHLNSHPIKNVKKVGVMKATITNTGHNIHADHDELIIGIKLSGSATPFAVEIVLDHRYAIITDIVNDINTKLQAYTNAGNSPLQNAVGNLVFIAVNNKIEIASGVLAGANAYYAPIVRLGFNPNTLWYELGFASVQQVMSLQLWENVIVPDIHINGGTSIYVKQSAVSTARVIKNNTFDLKGFHTIQIENPKGFYIASKTLTSGGNVFRTKLAENNTAQVDFDEHLIYIPNKASRDEYNHYETNVIEWHELHGDIQNFDVELRNHADKTFAADPEKLESSGDGSAIPPYMMTLVFECVNPNVYQPSHTQAYQSESWFEAHRQN
jgi:hypothetical protein